MARGHVQRSIGKAGEVHTRFAFVLQARRQAAVFQTVDIACVGERVVLPQALDHVEEFAGALVTQVVFQEVAIGPLVGRVAAGDDVPVQAATAEVLQDRCLLRGIGGQRPGGLEGDQEADAAGFAGQRSGGDPWLRAGGQQCAFEAGQFGSLGYLGDVVDVGETVGLATRQPAGGNVAGAMHGVAAVVAIGGQLRTVGAQRQAPEEFGGHGGS